MVGFAFRQSRVSQVNQRHDRRHMRHHQRPPQPPRSVIRQRVIGPSRARGLEPPFPIPRCVARRDQHHHPHRNDEKRCVEDLPAAVQRHDGACQIARHMPQVQPAQQRQKTPRRDAESKEVKVLQPAGWFRRGNRRLLCRLPRSRRRLRETGHDRPLGRGFSRRTASQPALLPNPNGGSFTDALHHAPFLRIVKNSAAGRTRAQAGSFFSGSQ